MRTRLALAGLILATVVLGQAAGAAAAPFGQEGQVHVVAWGETLTSIALRHGTTVGALAESNGISNPDLIRVGQRLKVPAASGSPASPPSEASEEPVVHVVGRGETLSSIARQYGTTVWAIAVANSLANPSLIAVNQRLTIPGAQEAGASLLPAPFRSVAVLPGAVVQGGTLAIQVETTRPVSLTAYIDDQAIPLAGGGAEQVGLVGMPCWAVPGNHTLVLTAAEASGETASISWTVSVLSQEFPVSYLTLSPEKSALLDPEIVAREEERVAGVFGTFEPVFRWEEEFLAPLEGTLRVTSPFGARRSYNGGAPIGYHVGLDYGSPAGTPVRACAPGRVALAEGLQVRGNTVILDHGMGVFSAYFHMSSLAVEAGQEVAAGDLIGAVGSSGLSTGAHLHWEMRVSGVAVDPWPWTQNAPLPTSGRMEAAG